MDKLVINGKITEDLEFGFSTEDGASEHKLLLTHHVKVPDEGDPLREQQKHFNRDYFIYLNREEMKKLRNTLDVVLNFTPEEPRNGS